MKMDFWFLNDKNRPFSRVTIAFKGVQRSSQNRKNLTAPKPNISYIVLKSVKID